MRSCPFHLADKGVQHAAVGEQLGGHVVGAVAAGVLGDHFQRAQVLPPSFERRQRMSDSPTISSFGQLYQAANNSPFVNLDGRIVQELVLVRITALDAHVLDTGREGQIRSG